jgi:predicted nucleic acid-binding protein
VKPVLLDTGVIVALLDRDEQWHAAVVEAIAELRSPLVTCEAVIAESCYLLRRLSGAPEAVIENVARGTFQLPFALSTSAREVKRIQEKYRDLRIDLADACLIRCAEEFGTGDILTLDREFRIYRWGRNRTFRLMIPLT